MGVLAVICFTIVGVNSTRKSATADSGQAGAVTPATPTKTAHDLAWENTKITKWHLRKDDLGITVKGDFTVRNDGDIAIKDLDIYCQSYASSGTAIDSNKRTIYEIVPAHSTKMFRNFDMGFIHSQAHSNKCLITDLVVLDPSESK